MKAWDILGYTADADIYCPDCAERRYGPDREGRLDREGNEVRPIFASDSSEWSESGAYCGDCGRELVEPFGA